MSKATVDKNNREILFTTRMTNDEAARVDALMNQLNASPIASGRKITRSTITRMGLELVLAQAAA